MRNRRLGLLALVGLTAFGTLQIVSASPVATPAALPDAASFVETIDNPYLPLIPGTTLIYEGESDGVPIRDEMTVTFDRKLIAGVDCVVVRDVAYEDGELIEETFDWYAQDKDGNVWYFGENSTSYEEGTPVSTEGSWEAGVDGAVPGIAMPAAPTVGETYYQEYLAGTAEDQAEVLAIGETASVKNGSYTEVVRTKEWSNLEPEIVEHKSYAPGIGMILAVSVQGENEHTELVEITFSESNGMATPTS